MSSCGRYILNSIRTALLAIDGTGDYYYALESVELRKHKAVGDEYEENYIAERPAIVVSMPTFSAPNLSGGSVDSIEWLGSIEVRWYCQSGADDGELQDAVADVMRALYPFEPEIDASGHKARLIADVNGSTFDPDAQLALDGFTLTFAMTWETELGDPDTGA